MSEWEREGEEERASEISCFVRTCVEHEWSRGRDPRLRAKSGVLGGGGRGGGHVAVFQEKRERSERDSVRLLRLCLQRSKLRWLNTYLLLLRQLSDSEQFYFKS